MKILKNYTFSWQEIGVLKLALLAIGVIIGSYWHEFFSANIMLVVIVAVLATIYSMYSALKQ